MTIGSLKIGGQKFRVIPEKEYREIRAAIREQARQAREDARDLAIARRRLKDPRRKSVPLSELKRGLGL